MISVIVRLQSEWKGTIAITTLVMVFVLSACKPEPYVPDMENIFQLSHDDADSLLETLPYNQESVDYLLQLSEDHHQTHPEIIYLCAEKAGKMSVRLSDRLGQAKSHYWLGWYWGGTSETVRKGITESLKSVELLKTQNKPFLLAKAYELTASNYFYAASNYVDVYEKYRDSALSYLNLATQTVPQINSSHRDSVSILAEIYDTYAWIYEFDSSGIDSVRFYEEQSIALYKSLDNISAVADGQMYLASVIGDRGEDEENIALLNQAQPYFEQAIHIFDSLNQPQKLAEAYYYSGRYYIQKYKAKPEEAWFQKGIQLYEKGIQIDSGLACDTYNGIGYAFYHKATTQNTGRTSNQDAAIQFYQYVIETVKESPNRSCLDKMVNYLGILCQEKLDCDTLMIEVAKAYQQLHDQDILNLEKERSELEAFRQQERTRKARNERIKWMWIIGGVISMLIIAFVFIIQKQRIAYLKQQLKIKLQALRAQMNPHFISNSLNAIEELIHDNQPKKAADYLIDFSRLCRMILHQSREEEITLQKEIESLKYILSLEQLRLSDKLTYSFEIEKELANSQVKIPAMLIQPYVENAIWHGITPLEEGGHLKISIHKDGPKELLCIVEDNGIGRKKSQERKQQSVFNRESWGMKITEERIETMNKIKGGKVEVEDLVDKVGNALGTRVKLYIPI